MIPEQMDEPTVSKEKLGEALRFIRQVNRRLGGAQALIGHLKRWAVHWPRNAPVTLIDLATGSADIPVLAVRWARSRGLDLRVTATDIHETTIELAREHVASNPDAADGIEIVNADAFALVGRFGSRSFDYAHAGMFLHHLGSVECLTMLRIMDRLSKRGLVWNDLVRSRLALAAVHGLTLGAPPMVRHDARASVRKGFTRSEVIEMARRVDLTWCGYESSLWAQRFTLAGERTGAWKT